MVVGKRQKSPSAMLNRPEFKPHYRAEAVPGEGLFIASAFGQTVLQGRLDERVAPG